MQLNHLHLSVSDVPACAGVFSRYFGFSQLEASSNAGFAVLSNLEGFVLVLMRHAKDVDPEQAYPPQFHVGFLIDGEAQVAQLHAEMTADGLHVSELEFSRGARRFYFRVPGGVLVEIGHRS
jgi:catechol 2,3-dioxygenase-like lactoylglutathione lyase family enzyme